MNAMAFPELYHIYYPRLLRFADELVATTEEAENIVQDVFADLWEKREGIAAIENMDAYLYRLVKNKCLDHLKRQLLERKYAEKTQASFEKKLAVRLRSLDGNDIPEGMRRKDLEESIADAVNSLPKRCREIFILSRFKGLKYGEIAVQLGLSVNTIKTQISIALKKIEVKLKHF